MRIQEPLLIVCQTGKKDHSYWLIWQLYTVAVSWKGYKQGIKLLQNEICSALAIKLRDNWADKKFSHIIENESRNR